MKNQTRHPFNVPVAGMGERYMTMDELLRAFRACTAIDPEKARSMAEYACDCGNLRAKLEYSRFLRITPNLSMPQAERYQTAERLLTELLNTPELSASLQAEAATELGTLYGEYLHRPVGALAMYLMAKRHGATVDEKVLQNLQKKMEKTDINHLGSNSRDSLRLGRELFYSGGAFRFTELFLREAVDKSAEEMKAGKAGAKMLHGIASLTLGDFYDAHSRESATYRRERDLLFAEAAKCGFPQYLQTGGDRGRKEAWQSRAG